MINNELRRTRLKLECWQMEGFQWVMMDLLEEVLGPGVDFLGNHQKSEMKQAALKRLKEKYKKIINEQEAKDRTQGTMF